MPFLKDKFLLGAAVTRSLRRILSVRENNNARRRCITTSADTNIKPKGSTPKVIKRIVSTLDPLYLQPADFIDLSSIVRPTLTLPGLERPKIKPRIALFYYGGVTPPFPNNTRGFFYYHHPPGLPFTASGLRFRVTAGTDPSPTNFDAGKDLLLPLGVPWQISFPTIASSSSAKYLRNYLLRCGTITQSQLDTCRQQFKGYLPAPYYTLYTLDQPFPISFGMYAVNLCAVGPGEILRFKISDPFSDKRERSSGTLYGRPYRGTALARLQVSTRPEHAGQDILVMQILKIIQPVRCIIPGYDGYMPPPEEGSLLHHRSVPGRGVRSQLWVQDLNGGSAASAALRVLRNVSPSRTLDFQDQY